MAFATVVPEHGSSLDALPGLADLANGDDAPSPRTRGTGGKLSVFGAKASQMSNFSPSSAAATAASLYTRLPLGPQFVQQRLDRARQLLHERLGIHDGAILGRALSLRSVPPDAYGFPRAKRIVESAWFDSAMAIPIVLNAIAIGAETEASLTAGFDSGPWAVYESAFLGIYVAELLVRFSVYGRMPLRVHPLFHNPYVMFDVLLVLIGILCAWVIPEVADDQDAQGLKPLLMLRLARLVRVVRTVRLFTQFRALWRLVRGLISSLAPLFYTAIIMVLVLFMFAVVGVEILYKEAFNVTAVGRGAWAHEPSAGWANVEPEVMAAASKFSSIGQAMLSLWQIATFDDAADLIFTLIHHRAYYALFFFPYIFIFTFSLMNLVTAVIVEGGVEHARDDHEQNKLMMEQEAHTVMNEAMEQILPQDLDSDGYMREEEFLRMHDDPQQLAYLVSVLQAPALTHRSALNELYHAIVQRTGSSVSRGVPVKLFIEQLNHMAGTAEHIGGPASLDLFKTMASAEGTKRELDELKTQVLRVDTRLTAGLERIEALLTGQAVAAQHGPPHKYEPGAMHHAQTAQVGHGPVHGVVQGAKHAASDALHAVSGGTGAALHAVSGLGSAVAGRLHGHKKSPSKDRPRGRSESPRPSHPNAPD